jgi:hypothetical protein
MDKIWFDFFLFINFFHQNRFIIQWVSLKNIKYLLASAEASTKVRIQCTQFSKLNGVIWATSLTKNARLSQHLTIANGSWAESSLSVILVLGGGTRFPRDTGWISPSLPTCEEYLKHRLIYSYIKHTLIHASHDSISRMARDRELKFWKEVLFT